MEQSPDQNQELLDQDHNKEAETVFFEEEGDSFIENLLRANLKGYQDAWTKNNNKHELEFSLSITNHKIATKDGNKNVAYLRLDRSIRPKGSDEEWETMLMHQEVYFFKSTKERLNPKKPWVEQLYINTLAKLITAGLEYAELLRRMKRPEAPQKTEEEETTERLNKLGLVDAKSMPATLTKEDEAYKTWLANERAKEGLQ